MSRTATGMAASPISPLTHSAQWKPPVSATAAARPWPISTRECAAAMVEATAIPIAPPICWEVSMSPAATPALRSVTPVSDERLRRAGERDPGDPRCIRSARRSLCAGEQQGRLEA